MSEPGSGTTLFLGGDVMTGRGVDQVLARSVDPELHEPYVKDARTYVELAEEAHGAIPSPVEPVYPWGDALAAVEREAPDARIVNLETAVTTADRPWPGKGIHYRMHPENVDVLTAPGIDCCVLANNHVLDWGRAGLDETLRTLDEAGLAVAGAGADDAAAWAPAALEADGGRRILVFGFAHTSAGVPASWAAGPGRSGVALLDDLSPETLERVGERVAAHRGPEDLVVASIHWGGNWGYRIPGAQRDFARGLVEDAGVDVVHGHSSHHPKGVEVHRGRPILYGAGDFLNDYEGIGGHERFRGDLVLMYVPSFAEDGALERFRMRPFRVRRFRLHEPTDEERGWLRERMDRECRKLGAGVEATDDGSFELRWTEAGG